MRMQKTNTGKSTGRPLRRLHPPALGRTFQGPGKFSKVHALAPCPAAARAAAMPGLPGLAPFVVYRSRASHRSPAAV